MALLQGIKKLFGPLLDDLDCVSAGKRPWRCRRRKEEDERWQLQVLMIQA
ncbi:MAG: hypothetical protein ACK56F_27680 [bacterium]